ncbi:hypothetical protein [Bifidobacterium eulemuris]|uniref:Uncharacterized protein n=1 Tax=Bifidobacterium eulemuris TaxID=1765219 RepID=A0A261GB89_9BIFI|nr:hypothetical protein [Bifidobacterium eulemuris]OZG68246.1 hypothetical protein BEUL_1259 [Bifidobacterium eulemuris]QOL31698.1 hypothetical protein BE0216_03895 [Bifidobacterium eulemuris]
MVDVNVVADGDKVLLYSPYDAECVKDCRQMGGKWDSGRRAWAFDKRDMERVERIAAKYFGYTPSSGAAGEGELVDVRFKAEDFYHAGEIRVGDRRLVWRTDRDRPVHFAVGVVVVEGRFGDSGGSAKNPSVGDTEGIVLEARGLPASVLEGVDTGLYELVSNAPDVTALRAERARLLERVAEIDALLAETAEK